MSLSQAFSAICSQEEEVSWLRPLPSLMSAIISDYAWADKELTMRYPCDVSSSAWRSARAAFSAISSAEVSLSKSPPTCASTSSLRKPPAAGEGTGATSMATCTSAFLHSACQMSMQHTLSCGYLFLTIHYQRTPSTCASTSSCWGRDRRSQPLHLCDAVHISESGSARCNYAYLQYHLVHGNSEAPQSLLRALFHFTNSRQMLWS